MEFGQKRDLYVGFGDTLAKSFELAATPAIFAFLGFLLDRWLGLIPLFTISFFILVLVFEFWRLFRQYDATMKVQEAQLRRSRR